MALHKGARCRHDRGLQADGHATPFTQPSTFRQQVYSRCARVVLRKHKRSHCYAANRVTYQSTSQLTHEEQLELEVLRPSEHHDHSAATALQFRPLTRSLLQHDQSHLQSQQYEQPKQYEVDASDGLVQQLIAAPDMHSLSAVLKEHAPALDERHIRAALIRMLQLHASGADKPSSSLHVAHACLADLCGSPAAQASTWQQPASHTDSANSSISSSSSRHQRPRPVSCWAVSELKLLGRVMSATAWFEPHVWQQLVEAAGRAAPTMTPADASVLLWVASRLHSQSQQVIACPPAAWLESLIERVAAGCGSPRLYPNLIAQALHACASLRHTPAPQCLDVLLETGVRHRLQDWQGPDIACVMWSLAVLQHHPGSTWLSDVFVRSEACVSTYTTGPAVASMLWSLAVMGHAPPEAWMTHFLWQVQRRLSVCDAHAISNIAWALARLRYRPPIAWSAQLLRTAVQHMHALPGDSRPGAVRRQQGRLRSAASQPAEQQQATSPLRSVPTPAQGTAAVASIDGAAATVAAVLWPPASSLDVPSPAPEHHTSPSQLPHHQPAAQHVQDTQQPALHPGLTPPLCRPLQRPRRPDSSQPPQQQAGPQESPSPSQATHHHMDSHQQPASQQQHHNLPPLPSSSSSASSTLSPASSQSEEAPMDDMAFSMWLEDVLDEPATWKGPGATPQAFTNFIWALAKLQVQPRPKFLHRMCAAMSPALHQFTAGQLAITLWSLQHMHHVPDVGWYNRVLALLRQRVPYCTKQTLLVAMKAMSGYACVHEVPNEMQTALLHRVRHVASSLSPSETASVLHYLSNTCRAPHSLLQDTAATLLRCAEHQLGSMSTQSATNLAMACVRLEGCGCDMQLFSGCAVLPRVAQHVSHHMPSCSVMDLFKLLEVCCQVNYQPEEEWLHAHESAVCAHVVRGAITPRMVSAALDSYTQMGHRASQLRSLIRDLSHKMSSSSSAARDEAGTAQPASGPHHVSTPPPGVPQHAVRKAWQHAADAHHPVAPAAAAASGVAFMQGPPARRVDDRKGRDALDCEAQAAGRGQVFVRGPSVSRREVLRYRQDLAVRRSQEAGDVRPMRITTWLDADAPQQPSSMGTGTGRQEVAQQHHQQGDQQQPLSAAAQLRGAPGSHQPTIAGAQPTASGAKSRRQRLRERATAAMFRRVTGSPRDE